MKNYLTLLITIIWGISSCKQVNTTMTSLDDATASKSSLHVKNHKLQGEYAKFIDTEFQYSESNGNNFIIQNSLPKGGMEYTAPNGKKYSYRLFWTLVINKTDNPIELSMEIPESLFELQSSPPDYFKILLPFEKMTIDKISLNDYGLTDLDIILDSLFLRKASLQKTIDPKNNSFFYVILLFNKEYEGVVRAGLSLKEDKLIYKVNDMEISTGILNHKIIKQQN